jgi:hypothetical protein
VTCWPCAKFAVLPDGRWWCELHQCEAVKACGDLSIESGHDEAERFLLAACEE